MAYWNLRWSPANAPYTVIAVIPVGSRWLNARIYDDQFQIKSFEGGWFTVFVIGLDAFPQLAIGSPFDQALDDNYRLVQNDTCLQLKNFDTGSWFTIVFQLEPASQTFLPAGVELADQIADDGTTTPPTLTILNVTEGDYCAPWIYDDGGGGLALAAVCPDIPPVEDMPYQDFTFYDSVGASVGINSANNGLPAPDSTDYSVFAANFNPTNFRLGVWCSNGTATGAGNLGWSLEYSTNLSSWSAVASSTLNVNDVVSEFVTVTGTLAVPGAPTVVYFRLVYANATGGDETVVVRALTLSVWRTS